MFKVAVSIIAAASSVSALRSNLDDMKCSPAFCAKWFPANGNQCKTDCPNCIRGCQEERGIAQDNEVDHLFDMGVCMGICMAHYAPESTPPGLCTNICNGSTDPSCQQACKFALNNVCQPQCEGEADYVCVQRCLTTAKDAMAVCKLTLETTIGSAFTDCVSCKTSNPPVSKSGQPCQ